MIHYINTNHDPALNLALEEYILCTKCPQENVLFFYINDSSVIIGRHQNTLDEIDQTYLNEHQIRTVRRLSGGGAVYHDHGNLNFSFICPGVAAATADFSIFTTPIVRALNALGAPVELSGRNDLILHTAKVSGNAYYHNAFGSVCHGTLLFDTDLEVLSKTLKPRPEKLLTRGIESVRSRVCNLRPALPEITDTQTLEIAIIEQIKMQGFDIHQEELAPADLRGAGKLADNRYRNDEWNIGHSPAYTLRKSLHTELGWMDICVDVRGGFVNDLRLFGDYFCAGDVSLAEQCFQNVPWKPDALRTVFINHNWESCFPTFPIDDFISLFF